jgi:hypothetical protein
VTSAGSRPSRRRSSSEICPSFRLDRARCGGPVSGGCISFGSCPSLRQPRLRFVVGATDRRSSSGSCPSATPHLERAPQDRPGSQLLQELPFIQARIAFPGAGGAWRRRDTPARRRLQVRPPVQPGLSTTGTPSATVTDLGRPAAPHPDAVTSNVYRADSSTCDSPRGQVGLVSGSAVTYSIDLCVPLPSVRCERSMIE